MKYYLDYINALGGNAEVSTWVEIVLAKRTERANAALGLLDQSEVEHILDYLLSPTAPSRLRRMSYEQAKTSADKWSKANQKHGRDIVETAADVETIHDFGDGARIVRLLTKNAFKREGFLMSHCVGGYNPDSKEIHIYSYRDKKNIPHATFEVQKKNTQIAQIKGKGNGPIHPRYIHPILAFLQSIGFKVRAGEMVNLGYYHVPSEMVETVCLYDGAKEQLQSIFGEKYLYWSGRFA